MFGMQTTFTGALQYPLRMIGCCKPTDNWRSRPIFADPPSLFSGPYKFTFRDYVFFHKQAQIQSCCEPRYGEIAFSYAEPAGSMWIARPRFRIGGVKVITIFFLLYTLIHSCTITLSDTKNYCTWHSTGKLP